MFEKFQARFNIKRIILVCDRGMLSKENLEYLESKQDIDYIVGARIRSVKEVKDCVIKRGGRYKKLKNGLKLKEIIIEDRRYVLVKNPKEAKHAINKREKIKEKLHLLEGKSVKSLVKHREVKRYISKSSGKISVNWSKIEEDARYDGKWVLRTNTMLDSEAIVSVYKMLWKVERDFRHLKGNLSIRPVYHWTERRIRGHILMCIIALRMEVSWLKLMNISGIFNRRRECLHRLRELRAVEVKLKDKKYIVRSECSKETHKMLNIVGVKLMQRVKEMKT
jgi:transposase